jgi:hypothetical protein
LVLMVIGVVLLVLVDAPRRVLWRLRDRRDGSTSSSSPGRPGPEVTDSPDIWIEPSSTPTPPDRPLPAHDGGATTGEREPPEAPHPGS